MLNFYDILQEIKKRPTLYLAKYSIFDFQSFYHGYGFARHEMGLPKTQEEKEFEDFLQWIRSIYPVKTRQSWANIILFHSADERNALDKMFGLFEDYKNRNITHSETNENVLEIFFDSVSR
ncbi:MAG: hypothetical protein ACM65L_03950 [Microcoleus sp.]